MSTKRIVFIPIKHDDEIELGDLGIFGVSGTSKYLGFKPGRAGKREGWLIVARDEVNTGATQAHLASPVMSDLPGGRWAALLVGRHWPGSAALAAVSFSCD